MIDWLAQYYTNGDWKKVTDWNIFVFSHRVKFLTLLEKEKAQRAKEAIRRGRRG